MNDHDKDKLSVPGALLGMLCIDEKFPNDFEPRGVFDAASFDYELVYETVQGASIQRIVDADPDLEVSFVAAARRLETKKPSVIVSNCGFSVVYQDAVQQSTEVPVALSALSLLAFLQTQLGESGQIAVITFDSVKLTPRHLSLACPSLLMSRCAVAGIEHSSAWTQIVERSDYVWPQIRADLMATVEDCVRSGNVELILLECAAFIDFADEIRETFQKPVFDLVSLCDLMMQSL